MGYIEEEKLKNILIQTNTITSKSLNSLYDKSANDSLIDYLIKKKLVDYKPLSNIIYQYFSIPSHKLSIEGVSEEALKVFDIKNVNKYLFFPFSVENGKVHIAMSNPLNDQARNDIRLISNRSVEIYFSNPSDIKLFINHFYNIKQIDSMTEQFKNNDTKNIVENAPVVKIVDMIISDAILVKASDIHIEPNKTNLRIRFRIDGVLKKVLEIDKCLAENIISRLKIMAGLDISNTKSSHDGHFKQPDIDNIDFRISTLPTIFGEKVVIRLIYEHGLLFDLEADGGFFEDDIEDIKQLLKNSSGAILVTGTTGSGKTTTLASFISHINKEGINIVTIEDPVENVLEGITQVSVNSQANLDFNNALKTILRQDPDVIMVGEIRDNETAAMAIGAAITGHLVFTTLHTNDALSSIVRLIDMGIESYAVSAAVKGIISQRLVRKLCNYCKKEVILQESIAKTLNLEPNTHIQEKVGCKFCLDTGYKGRFAIYEFIIMTDKLKSLIENKAGFEEIRETLIKDDMVTIKDNAIKHLINGNTSLEEVLKVII